MSHTTDHMGNLSVAEAIRTIAVVLGVVLMVLTLLVAGVYAVVVIDLAPQMRLR